MRQGLSRRGTIRFEHALLCQVRGEVTPRRSVRAARHCAPLRHGGRSALKVKTKTYRLNSRYRDCLTYRTDGPLTACTHFTFAGLGYMGTNERRVAFCQWSSRHEWRLGLPQYPLKRTLLEQRDVAACLQMVEKQPMCSANMVFCDGEDNIADVEIRPEGAELFDERR